MNSAKRPLEVTNIHASGGLMSTPTDVLAFAPIILDQEMSGTTRVLSDGSLAEMGTSQLATPCIR